MAKDISDSATMDLIKPGRGGYRSGAGRKKGEDPPKKQPSWRVSQEAIDAIKKVALETDKAPGDILDWVMKNHKKIPKNL